MNVAYISSNIGLDGTPAFGRPIIEELDARGHDVLLYRHTNDPAVNAYQLGQIKTQAHRVFVDWAQTPLDVVLQQWGPNDCPVIVRAHRIEMYNREFIKTLPWGNVACLLFIAQHVQDRFLEAIQGEPPQRVVNVGHVGVDTAFWTPGEPGTRPAEPPWRIVIAGSVTPKKRQYTVVQMLADLPEAFHLDLIGNLGMPGYGNAEYGENITDLVRELGLEDRMQASGALSREDLRERLRQAHLVISASNEEGCATIVAEAMACGCVPLLNCWRGVRDIYPVEWVWRTPKELYGLCELYAAQGAADRERLHAGMPEKVARFDAATIARQVCDIITGPIDAASVGRWYDEDAQFNHLLEQYGNARQEAALAAAKVLLPPDPAGVQILEVGCSLGYITHNLEAAGYRSIGIDVAERCLQWAREHGKGLFIAADATGRLPEGPFDLVTLIDVYEHIPRQYQQATLIRCLHTLKPGGYMLIRVPHGRTDKQIVETEVYPKAVRQVLQAHRATIERFGPCEDTTYFEIVARKAG